jgi:hypothetical protein
MTEQVDSVLYGPSIEFRSGEWLKCALLLWDAIYRIVPTGYSPADSDLVSRAEDAGLIRTVTLEREDLSQVSSEFLTFLRSLPFTPAGLEPDRIERLHPAKVDGRLYPLLEKMAVNVDPDGFLCLPREVAHGYMLYLAKAVSSRRNLATVTDSGDEWAIMPYFKEHGNFGELVYDRGAAAFYSFIIFTDILPTGLGSVDPEKIVQFSSERKDEKSRLRAAIHQFGDKVGACSSVSHIKELIADYEREITKAKDDFKRSIGFYNEGQGCSLLTVGLPVAFGLFSLFADDPFSTLKLSSSILVGAVAAFADYKKVQKVTRPESYTSYLVEIDRELAEGSAQTAHFVFENFIND